MKIIVLSKTNYKEKDVIIDAISENGPISFKIRGGQAAQSPFYWLTNELTIADVEYVENPRYIHQILKNAMLVDSPYTGKNNLDIMSAALLGVEAVRKMLPEDERIKTFKMLENYCKAIKDGQNLLFKELVFIAKMIKLSGFEPEVDRCVFCGSQKHILVFSFAEGGFICRNCLDQDFTIDLNGPQLTLIRFIFKTPDFTYLPESNYKIDDLKIILQKFYNYIDDGIGVILESISFILNN